MSSRAKSKGGAGRQAKRRKPTPQRPPTVRATAAPAAAALASAVSPRKVIAACTREFASHANDCNDFVEAVSAAFFGANPFVGLDANHIISTAAARWRSLAKDHAAAIVEAQAGSIVLAGMTASELGDEHGHVGIVVGDPGALSGTVLVPICYAGSLKPSARVARERVSATFGATNARNSLISYFAATPDQEPADDAFEILFNLLAPSLALARGSANRNVDVSKPDGERVKAMWALIHDTVEDVDAGRPATVRENVKRFLLHVAWHEGARIKERRQIGGGPGRSFYQFEAPRAFDACEYGDRKGALGTIAATTDRNEATVRAGYKAISGAAWPLVNTTIEDCMVGFDFFATYTIRYALLKLPAAIPTGNDDHAVYWADYWKVSFPGGDRAAQIKKFKNAADAVDTFPV